MPKRVIDFDALWASDKISDCAEWAQAEYAWLYGLADCAGCFELTNLRVIWGRVAAVRRNFSMERLEQVFAEFQDKGIAFCLARKWQTLRPLDRQRRARTASASELAQSPGATGTGRAARAVR